MDFLPYKQLLIDAEQIIDYDDVHKLKKVLNQPLDQDTLNLCLYLTAKKSKLNCLKELYDRGAKIDYWNSSEDETTLGIACKNGNRAVCETLLQAGCDVNIRARGDMHSPIHSSIYAENIECLILLLNFRANIDSRDCFEWTPLMLACKLGNNLAVKTLLIHGCNANIENLRRKSAFDIAMKYATAKCLEELLIVYPKFAEKKNCSDIYHLTDAIKSKNKDLVQAFVDSGCDLNTPESSMTPLNLAVEMNDIPLVRMLSKGGANLDLLLPLPLNPTVLMIAVLKNNVEMVKALIEEGCNIDKFDNMGRSALYFATKYGYYHCVCELLYQGANPNAYAADLAEEYIERLNETLPAPTPLHAAILYDKKDEAIHLVKAGCDVDFPALYHGPLSSVSYYTPMQVACDRRFSWAVLVLLTAGSKCIQPVIESFSLIGQDTLSKSLSLLTCKANCKSLKLLCRSIVRQNLQFPLIKTCKSLTIPLQIKSFLLYSELDSLI